MANASAEAKEPQLFGHPRGLTYLFSTEMAERFSYYGMTAILLYYLTEQLLAPSQATQVIGFGAIHSAFESLYGPLTPVEFATNLVGWYTGLVYFTPFFGGLLADRVTGQRYIVIVGGALMAAGEFMLTQTPLFFFGLLMLIVGNGCFKPNISTQVGNLYKPGDSRIDRAYSIFYVGINIGATLSPFICGTLGERMCTAQWPWSKGVCEAFGQTAGWHFGFFAAGIGVTLGLLVYLSALRNLPPDRVTRAKREKTAALPKLTRQDWRAIIALVLVCIPASLFWITYQQQSITILLWARDFTNLTLIPGGTFQIPATWSQSVNPIFIFVLTPGIVALWGWQSKRGSEPSTVLKLAIGCLFLAGSFLIMSAIAWMTGPHGHASWEWLILFFAIYTLGELYLSPIGLALMARVAPPQVLSAMMGVWFISIFLGNTLAGYLGSYWDKMDKVSFFLLAAAIPAVAGAVIWLFDKPTRPIIEERTKNAPLQPGPDIASETVSEGRA